MFCDETNGPNQETDREQKKMRSRGVEREEGRGQETEKLEVGPTVSLSSCLMCRRLSVEHLPGHKIHLSFDLLTWHPGNKQFHLGPRNSFQQY